MKVLQISRQFFPSIGGIENVIYHLSSSLQKRGFDIDIVTLRTIFNIEKIVEKRSVINGLNIYRLSHIGIKRYPIAPSVISFVSSYDILHVHAIDFFIDFLSLTRIWHRKPIVVNTHGGIFHTRWFSSFKKLYFEHVTRFSLLKADAVICISKKDYELFQAIVPDTKLYVVPNGVNIEPFLNIRKEIVSGLLLGIGRVVKHKRIEKIISLLPLLVQEFPDVHLIWIGSDPENYIPQLLTYAQQIGVQSRVKFLGQVSDDKVQNLLSQAHLFVSGAEYEGFGISTIEAMSSGTVPVVTPVGIHPEVVREGETGFIYSFKDQQALECFRHVLSLDRQIIAQIGNNAREIVMQYSWSNVVNSYIEIYKSVLLKTI